MGLSRSKVRIFTFFAGLIGVTFGQSFQWFLSASYYPLVTGGKPLNSAEAFVPISFETMVLSATFGTIIGMLVLNRLPRLYHPLFGGRDFGRATDDGFFLAIEAEDPAFDPDRTAALLKQSRALSLEVVRGD